MKKITHMTLSALMISSALAITSPVQAGDHGHAINQTGAVLSEKSSSKVAAFDILAAHAHRDGNNIVFHMTTAGEAGSVKPDPVGSLAGAPVFTYVWPTSLDPATVGFEGKSGILALAATSHPDFDDTPLYDENGDGDKANDGAGWHSHWVVLTGTEGCGEGALGVRNIPEGAKPALPSTWPGLPIYIDSPDFTPVFDGPEISISVNFGDVDIGPGVSFDGVTAAMRVNANLHAPLLCVTEIFDVASGDLSLPGKIN